jgi:hypothetical protein
MVFMSHRCAEQCEDAVAGGLGDITAVPAHCLHHQLERRIDDGAGFFGVEVLDQIHRSFDVGEQHSDCLALTLDIFGRCNITYPNRSCS